MIPRHRCMLLFAGVVAFLSSCGTKPQDAPESTVKQQPAALEPRRQQAAELPGPVAKQAIAPRTSPAEKKETPKKNDDVIDPATDPNDIFMVGGNSFEFQTSAGAPDHGEKDFFAVVVPPAGDFETFAPTLPPHEAAVPTVPFKLPDGFTAIPSAGFVESGLPRRIRCEKDQSVMVLVPAGTSPIGKEGGPKESAPQLSVYLDNYYIDTTETTLVQYETFRKAIKEQKGRTMREPLNGDAPPNYPVLGAPWSEIMLFASWCGKELPNEAEWEKGARGEQGFEYPWGAGRPVWSSRRAVSQIDAVVSYQADKSTYGIYDLAGNAREWCIDYYSPTLYSEAAEGGPVVRAWRGPKRPPSRDVRVVRGGVSGWEVWRRQGVDTKDREQLIGFRCVLRISNSSTTRNTAK